MMHSSKLLPFFILFTVIGLLVTRQQVAETLLLYEIQDQERLAMRLGDANQILQVRVHALASPGRLVSALAHKTHPLESSPVAVVRVEEPTQADLKLAKRRPGLLERLSLIRVAEARSR